MNTRRNANAIVAAVELLEEAGYVVMPPLPVDDAKPETVRLRKTQTTRFLDNMRAELEAQHDPATCPCSTHAAARAGML